MKKTLGGDRLGSGNKQKVELNHYNRSTHDLSYIWRSTMSAGTLVPFMVEIALPGDTLDIKLDIDIKTHPTIGPLLGSYKIQADIFEAPIRLYNAHLHNNTLGIGLNMAQITFPVFTFYAPSNPDLYSSQDNTQVNPSSLLAYIGFQGAGYNGTVIQRAKDINALAVLTYYDIYKNYYANKQEEIGAVIHTDPPALVTTVSAVKVKVNITGGEVTIPQNAGATQYPGNFIEIEYPSAGAVPIPSQIMLTTSLGTFSATTLCPGLIKVVSGGATDAWAGLMSEEWGIVQFLYWKYQTKAQINQIPPKVATFPLSNIDTMRTEILAHKSFAPFNINTDPSPSLPPYVWATSQNANQINYALSSQQGLALKTYQSDLFNNWIQTEWIDGPSGISAITAVDTGLTNSFTIDTLNLAKKVYDMLNRVAVSGGSYDDWIDAVYQENKYARCETPIYHGGLIKELVFQEIVSNAAAAPEQSGLQPLGTLAGKGAMAKKHKGGEATIKVSEPSIIMGIISITPRVDYSQGNRWYMSLQTLDDLHKPALDEIGFQELVTDQMAWWDTYWDAVNGEWVKHSAGKQPAWINYMTNYNRTYGNFAIPNNEMFMTLNRRYEWDPTAHSGQGGLKDLTTYIDPTKFNQIFAQTSLDAQNFWAQVAVDITARRLMSARIMPNL